MPTPPLSPQLENSSARRVTAISVIGFCLLAAGFVTPANLTAQSTAQDSSAQAQRESSQLSGPYRTWLDEDVRWIITPDERSAYLALQKNSDRLEFIKDFWQHRNPDSASTENSFREEHYRRIAFANTHFAVKQPGWTTDRGRIYIVDGKPDSIDSHTSGAQGDTKPFEVWHYHRLQQPWQSGGIVDVKFVDECRCGDYKLVPSPNL
jgi:GWxTD domain-containing protein